MKIKFEDLASIENQPIPLAEKPKRNGDHAIISYITLRNDTLNISVTSKEIEEIEFSQDYKYMQLPSFLTWKKGSKGPYLTHVTTPATANAPTTIQW